MRYMGDGFGMGMGGMGPGIGIAPSRTGVSAGYIQSYRKSDYLKHGKTKIPGKGDGTKDTVPAMLAPGEAVLNKAAAETVGRKKITQLNKKGALKMGMLKG